MLPAIVVKDDSLARGIETAGSALGKALGERAKEKRTRDLYTQSGSILQSLIQDLPENPSISDLQGIYSKAIQSNVPPEIIKMYADMYMPNIKARAQGQASTELMNQFGLGTPEKSLKSPEEQTAQQIAGFQPTALQRSLPFYQEPEVKQTPIQTIKDVRQQVGAKPIQEEVPFNQRQEPTISDKQLTMLALSPDRRAGDFAKLELQRREMQRKKFVDVRNFHESGSAKALEDTDKLREAIRGKDSALALARQAVETGETGPLSWANISRRLDVPELMNAAGTELNQAGKEFFFGNMQRVAAKAQNQWLEQRITQLAAQVGDPKINALMKQTMLEAELDTSKAYLNAFDRISQQDMEKYGYVRKDIQSRAYQASEEASKKILDRTSYKTRQLYEEEKGSRWLKENVNKKVPKGTVLTSEMINVMIDHHKDIKKAVENALKLGYKVPTQQEVEAWQQ